MHIKVQSHCVRRRAAPGGIVPSANNALIKHIDSNSSAHMANSFGLWGMLRPSRRVMPPLQCLHSARHAPYPAPRGAWNVSTNQNKLPMCMNINVDGSKMVVDQWLIDAVRQRPTLFESTTKLGAAKKHAAWIEIAEKMDAYTWIAVSC